MTNAGSVTRLKAKLVAGWQRQEERRTKLSINYPPTQNKNSEKKERKKNTTKNRPLPQTTNKKPKQTNKQKQQLQDPDVLYYYL